jgi:hypothetical protein
VLAQLAEPVLFVRRHPAAVGHLGRRCTKRQTALQRQLQLHAGRPIPHIHRLALYQIVDALFLLPGPVHVRRRG